MAQTEAQKRQLRQNYQALREAGFTPTEARRMRYSNDRAKHVTRLKKEGFPVETIRMSGSRDPAKIREAQRVRELERLLKRIQPNLPRTKKARAQWWANRSREKAFTPGLARAIKIVRDNFVDSRREPDNTETTGKAYAFVYEMVVRRQFRATDMMVPDPGNFYDLRRRR